MTTEVLRPCLLAAALLSFFAYAYLSLKHEAGSARVVTLIVLAIGVAGLLLTTLKDPLPRGDGTTPESQAKRADDDHRGERHRNRDQADADGAVDHGFSEW